MCGILGYLKFNDKIDTSGIGKLILSIKHRGPDHQGYWISNDEKKLLINTRLSILDTSKKGNQPFFSKDRRFIIVYNGEIYNFKELKNFLKEFNFQSETDTEVILYLYVKFREKCLNYLEGMFSFAIYDTLKDELFCARDQFGIKPFYYAYRKNEFFFSSELRSFFVNGGFKKIPNLTSIKRYLTSEYYEHLEETFYEGIFKLKPGHFLKIKNNKIIENQFWNFRDELKKKIIPKNLADKEKYFYNLTNNSVSKSFISDVPITIASSGGLDSSIIHYIAKKKLKKIDSISFDFMEKKFSEKKFVEKISKKTNSKTSYFTTSPNIFIKNIESSINKLEEPFAGLPIISYLLLINKKAKNKVVIDGSGLDEIHCGYDKYFNLKKKMDLTISQDKTKSVHSNYLGKSLDNLDFSEKFNSVFDNHIYDSMYKDLFYVKLPRALRFRDKLGMASSREIRPSFLNTDLVLSFFKLKISDHYKKKLGKNLLRKIYEKKIGKEISYSKKRNIQTPQTQWFRNELRPWVDDFVKDLSIYERGWIDKGMLNLNLDLFYKKKLNNSFFIWQMINLEYWSRGLD